MTRPTGANSNIEYGACPYLWIVPLTARLVDVPMRVQLPPSIAPKARGISSFDGGTFALAASPITTGRNIAVVVVFFKTDAVKAAENMISDVSTKLWFPDHR